MYSTPLFYTCTFSPRVFNWLVRPWSEQSPPLEPPPTILSHASIEGPFPIKLNKQKYVATCKTLMAIKSISPIRSKHQTKQSDKGERTWEWRWISRERSKCLLYYCFYVQRCFASFPFRKLSVSLCLFLFSTDNPILDSSPSPKERETYVRIPTGRPPTCVPMSSP